MTKSTKNTLNIVGYLLLAVAAYFFFIKSKPRIVFWVSLVALIIFVLVLLSPSTDNESIIQNAADEVERETSGERGISTQAKYDLLNAKLSKYGLWVGPIGSTPPPASNLKKCCCRSSIFFGVIAVDCYWNVDCNSQSAQSACSSSSA